MTSRISNSLIRTCISCVSSFGPRSGAYRVSWSPKRRLCWMYRELWSTRGCKSSKGYSWKPTVRLRDWIRWLRVRCSERIRTRSSNGYLKSLKHKPHNYRRPKKIWVKHSYKTPRKIWPSISNEMHYRNLMGRFNTSKIEQQMLKRRLRYSKPNWLKDHKLIEDRVLGIQLKELRKIQKARDNQVPI